MEEIDKKILNEFDIFDETIVVGCSAGPDSMALLSFLFNNTNYNIVCAHINHKVRKESDVEEEYLSDYCALHGIVFEKMDILEYKEKNFENEARKRRYAFYEEILRKYGSHYLFLAHHGDDLMETILMKIVRGSNLMGYAGMKTVSKWKDYYIMRPFLTYTKDDLIAYDNSKGIKFFRDSTNDDINYTRNRYRKKIIPLLKSEDDKVHKRFKVYSDILLEYDAFTKDVVDKELLNVYNDGCLDIEKFKKIHVFLQKNIIFKILSDIYKNPLNVVKNRHVDGILKMIRNRKPNLSIQLPRGYIATKEYDRVYIDKNRLVKSDDYEFELKRHNVIGKWVIERVLDVDSNGNDVCRIDSSKIKLPLYIRNRRPGDAMSVLGLDGRQKIKNIFIEKRVPVMDRQSYPLVVDSENRIIWIPNLKKSQFNSKNSEKCDIILKYCEKGGKI